MNNENAIRNWQNLFLIPRFSIHDNLKVLFRCQMNTAVDTVALNKLGINLVSIWNHTCTSVMYLNFNTAGINQRWATGWIIGGSSPCRGWEFFSSPPELGPT